MAAPFAYPVDLSWKFRHEWQVSRMPALFGCPSDLHKILKFIAVNPSVNFMFRQPSANVGRPKPSCITLFEGLQIGSSLILLAATATNGTCVCPSWIMLGCDQQWLRGAPFHDLALSMSLGYPQGLHLKPLKPQLPSWLDGRLFRGKCLLRPKSTNSS